VGGGGGSDFGKCRGKSHAQGYSRATGSCVPQNNMCRAQGSAAVNHLWGELLSHAGSRMSRGNCRRTGGGGGPCQQTQENTRRTRERAHRGGYSNRRKGGGTGRKRRKGGESKTEEEIERHRRPRAWIAWPASTWRSRATTRRPTVSRA